VSFIEFIGFKQKPKNSRINILFFLCYISYSILLLTGQKLKRR